jgi:hypothetical protein
MGKPKLRQMQGKGRIKSPAGHGRDNFDTHRPLFSLASVVSSHCITICETNDRAAFATKLRNLSQLTWRELKSAPAHGLGYEPIDRDHLRVPIPASLTDDVTIISFRFSGTKAMIGYRVDDVFHILWFDRDYDVYPH